MPLPSVGVIGTGAMGLGVVQSLVRGGFRVHARDIRPQAEAAAVTSGATAWQAPAALARQCEIVILLVVDANQIETVLFGADGALPALARGSTVVASSTVPPAYVEALAPRLDRHGVWLLDAPVSGGPRRAADGTMTIMVAGGPEALKACATMLPAIAGKVFRCGAKPGAAAKCKIVNNLLAAANLAAGAEALALGIKAGVDPRLLFDIIGASSGASWIFSDRMARALEGDYAPRAATKILTKDAGIALTTAKALGFDAPLARVTCGIFADAIAAGYGDEDDAALLKLYCDRNDVMIPGDEKV